MNKFMVIFSITLFIASCGPKETVDPDYSFDLEHPTNFGKPIIPADNQMNSKAVEIGRRLFYDTILSLDSSLSCASCHQQSRAFTDEFPKSIGFQGKELDRSSMTIVNAAWQRDFFWDGRAKSLEEQALMPIENPNEMNLSIAEAIERLNASEDYRTLFKEAFDADEINQTLLANCIAQFERTLISKDSKYDQYLRGEYTMTESEKNGMDLFFTHPEPFDNLRGGNCGDCHGGVLTFQNRINNNGLDSVFTDLGRFDVTGNPNDSAKFKAPTLRNIAVSAPYMHDGRFTTLEEVLDHYNEHIAQSSTLDPLITSASNNIGGSSLGLTDTEKADIIAFLKTLTDETFLNNPNFSNPF